MVRIFCIFRFVAVVALLAAPAGFCQSVSASGTVLDALHQMADRADVVFTGQVTSVRRLDGGGVASGVVEVQFQVDQAVRGCTAGTPYVLREWAGLWEGGEQRYRVGQRLLMLLHAPGPSGLGSPVDGLDGAIPIVRGGTAPLAAGSSKRVAPPSVDLRWVATKMQQTVSYRNASAHTGQQAKQPGAQSRVIYRPAEGTTTQVAPIIAPMAVSGPGEASVPSQQASVDVVVGMLVSWQKVQHASSR